MTIEKVTTAVYTVPTDSPESDGTYQWASTTMVLVELHAGRETGLGYTYADGSTATLIDSKLAKAVTGLDSMDLPAANVAMRQELRNLGCSGIAAMAISAVDVALWDLKAKLLGVSLAELLGRSRVEVPVYGSGGFTSYTIIQLEKQLAGWVEAGIPRVKMKIGREPAADPERVHRARQAISAVLERAELMVDANGAYGPKQAIELALQFEEEGVSWFEEPVPSSDPRYMANLGFVRDRVAMDVAGGEYGYLSEDFQRLLPVVDVLQADATRCHGISGFLRAANLAASADKLVSSHCAPTIHRHLGASVENFKHLEWFHDHVRIERFFFDGFAEPENGSLSNSRDLPGLGVVFKHADAEQFRAK